MTWYLVRRIGQSIAVIIGVMILTFILVHFEPGSTARAVLGLKATPARIALFDNTYGLNRPLPVQFLALLRARAAWQLRHLVYGRAAGVHAHRAAAAP